MATVSVPHRLRGGARDPAAARRRCTFSRPVAPRPTTAKDAQVVDLLRKLGGTPEWVLADQSVLAMILRPFRADFSVKETYEYQPEPPLSTPITVIAGTDDPRAGIETMAGWREQTTAPYRLHTVTGGHFAVLERPEVTHKIIAEALAMTAAAGPRRPALGTGCAMRLESTAPSRQMKTSTSTGRCTTGSRGLYRTGSRGPAHRPAAVQLPVAARTSVGHRRRRGGQHMASPTGRTARVADRPGVRRRHRGALRWRRGRTANPDFPAERTRQMITAAGPDALIVDERGEALLSTRRRAGRRTGDRRAHRAPLAAPMAQEPDDVAYILFTSGRPEAEGRAGAAPQRRRLSTVRARQVPAHARRRPVADLRAHLRPGDVRPVRRLGRGGDGGLRAAESVRQTAGDHRRTRHHRVVFGT